jgi:hypothetical protein
MSHGVREELSIGVTKSSRLEGRADWPSDNLLDKGTKTNRILIIIKVRGAVKITGAKDWNVSRGKTR